MNDLIVIAAVPMFRSVAGWLNIALEDGKITMLEWRKLAKTVLRLGVPALALYYGFNIRVEISATIPLIVDYAFETLTKFVKKANNKIVTTKAV